MRISVVTPSFNMAPYLEDTITSVIGNLRPGDEYFIIDAGSTDRSVDIVRRHEQHLTGWVSEEDAGYADAIASGRYEPPGFDLILGMKDVRLALAAGHQLRAFRQKQLRDLLADAHGSAGNDSHFVLEFHSRSEF